MKRIMTIYQFVSPLIAFPAACIIWYNSSKGSIAMTLLAVLIPVFFGYVVAGLGTTLFKLWEFDSNFKIGKYTTLHGFMFGGPSALLVWLSLGVQNSTFSYFEIVKTGFVAASVLGFWNWIFDIYAVKSGFAVVRNKPAYHKQEPEAVVTDYAPVYFGTFGFCYSVSVATGWYIFVEKQIFINLPLFFSLAMLISLLMPVILSILCSYLKHGYPGITPYEEERK